MAINGLWTTARLAQDKAYLYKTLLSILHVKRYKKRHWICLNILLRNSRHLPNNVTGLQLKLRAKTCILLVWYTGVNAHAEKNTLERQKESAKKSRSKHNNPKKVNTNENVKTWKRFAVLKQSLNEHVKPNVFFLFIFFRNGTFLMILMTFYFVFLDFIEILVYYCVNKMFLTFRKMRM